VTGEEARLIDLDRLTLCSIGRDVRRTTIAVSFDRG